MSEPINLSVAEELLNMALRIDNDGTASQIVSADELRALASRVTQPIDINPRAWAYAVKADFKGTPLWAYLADEPRALAAARLVLSEYLNAPIRP